MYVPTHIENIENVKLGGNSLPWVSSSKCLVIKLTDKIDGLPEEVLEKELNI